MRLRPVTRLRVRLENLLAIWTKLFPVCRESPPICKRCWRERRAQADDKGNELAVEINFRSRQSFNNFRVYRSESYGSSQVTATKSTEEIRCTRSDSSCSATSSAISASGHAKSHLSRRSAPRSGKSVRDLLGG